MSWSRPSSPGSRTTRASCMAAYSSSPCFSLRSGSKASPPGSTSSGTGGRARAPGSWSAAGPGAATCIPLPWTSWPQRWPPPSMAPPGGVMLDVQSATVAFGGVRAVDDVSFRIDDQCLGIGGANGAGKTTLLNAISVLVSLRSGHVILDDSDLSHVGAWCRAQHGMGRSFQHPLLMDSMTLEENLGGGRRVASSAL